MLPLLFFPVVLPVIVAAVEASGAVILGDAGSELRRWVPLMAVFDAVFLVVCPVGFILVVEE
jgi:heme exporter protein B